MGEHQTRMILVLFPAELQNKHQQEQSQLTETFQAAERVLKVNVISDV